MMLILVLLIIVACAAVLVLWLFRLLRITGLTTLSKDTTAHLSSLVDSSTLRSIIITVLALVMLIPLGLVGGVVKERDIRHRGVLSDIASTWGQPQTLLAPVVVVPFTESILVEEKVTDEDGRTRLIQRESQHRRTAQFLPKKLDIDVELDEETRQRGIFESLVYRATVRLDAEFVEFDVNSLSDKVSQIHWDKSWLAVGLSDTGAINSVKDFQWNNATQELAPGTQLRYLPSGFHAPLTQLVRTAEGSTHRLQIVMDINGSGSFKFTPFGETTTVSVTSTWPHPSFQGDALPDEHYISAEGFNASWTIPHLARNYPQRWSSNHGNFDLLQFSAGVSMFEPVSLYSTVTRAVKYGILFVGLTFLTLYIFELSTNIRLHSIQYALIGVALSLFYLVLLSLSEHIHFLWSYTSAALLTVFMISCYTWFSLRSFTRAALVMTMLTALYVVLYSLLQMEDYALLMGTALLVFMVMVLMFVTRNVKRLS